MAVEKSSNDVTHSASSIVVNILRLLLSRDGHETLQDRASEVVTLDFRLFAAQTSQLKSGRYFARNILLHGPAERVEGKDTQFHVVVAVRATP